MKIMLLGNAGYSGLESVKFPVEVEAEWLGGYYEVPSAELERIGADMFLFEDDEYSGWAWDCEHVSEVQNESEAAQ